MTDNMPDFDSMSPEEIMAWMETLAKRQGASEGFMTEADVDIAEIDPDTVVIDEPGYVPFGQEAPEKPQAAPARTAAEPPAPPPRPAAPPEPAPQPLTPAWVRPAPAASSQPSQPQPPAPPRITPVEPELPQQQPAARREEVIEEPAIEQGSLAWLESLAADQDDTLFNLDLSDIAEEQPAATNPVTWLEDLARNQGEMQPTPPPPAPSPLGSDAESMTWLESLARRQGANPEEFTTAADLDVPTPEEEVEEPAYTPFSFDTPTTLRTPSVPDPLRLEDPTDFLGSLAKEQGYSEQGVLATQPTEETPEPDMSIEGIQQAINAGTVTPEQMQVFLEHEAEFALQAPEIPLIEDYDPDAPPVPAELPDWLLEQVGPPPTAREEEAPAPAPVEDERLESVFAEPPASALDDMPDWLKADITTADQVNLEDIFAQNQSEPEQPAPVVMQPERQPEIEFDPNDPWAEAFDTEAELGEINIDEVPDWYARNINDPQRIAVVEGLVLDQAESAEAGEPAVETPAQAVLAPSAPDEDLLPQETLLSRGEQQPLPEWTPTFEPAATEPFAEEPIEAQTAEPALDTATFVSPDMPDWLRDVGGHNVPEEIPDWLKETLGTEEEAENIFIQSETVLQAPEPEPFPAYVPPVQTPPVQTPPAAPRQAPVTATLEGARSSSQSGDLDSSLAQYEVLIRTNVDLDAAVEDLSHMVRVHNGSPAVYRVLGDGFMRQGKLQAALDTYRQALNQL